MQLIPARATLSTIRWRPSLAAVEPHPLQPGVYIGRTLIPPEHDEGDNTLVKTPAAPTLQTSAVVMSVRRSRNAQSASPPVRCPAVKLAEPDPVTPVTATAPANPVTPVTAPTNPVKPMTGPSPVMMNAAQTTDPGMSTTGVVDDPVIPRLMESAGRTQRGTTESRARTLYHI